MRIPALITATTAVATLVCGDAARAAVMTALVLSLTEGAVKVPVLSTVPTVELPPTMLLTDHCRELPAGALAVNFAV